MREADFIFAANLARVRIALHAAGHLTPTDGEHGTDKALKEAAIRALYHMEARWQAKLERRKVSP